MVRHADSWRLSVVWDTESCLQLIYTQRPAGMKDLLKDLEEHSLPLFVPPPSTDESD